MKKLILLSIIFIVGCGTKPVISPKPTVYFDGMSEEIFNEKNDGLAKGVYYKLYSHSGMKNIDMEDMELDFLLLKEKLVWQLVLQIN